MKKKVKYISVYDIDKMFKEQKLEDIFLNKDTSNYIENIESYIYAYMMIPLSVEERDYLITILNDYISTIIIRICKRRPIFLLHSKISLIFLEYIKHKEININEDVIKRIEEVNYKEIYSLFIKHIEDIKRVILNKKEVSSLIKYDYLTNDLNFRIEFLYLYKNDEDIHNNSKLEYMYNIKNISYEYLKKKGMFDILLKFKYNINELNNITLDKIKKLPYKNINDVIINMNTKEMIKFLNSSKLINMNNEYYTYLVKKLPKQYINKLRVFNFEKLTKEDFKKIIEVYTLQEVIEFFIIHSSSYIQRKNISLAIMESNFTIENKLKFLSRSDIYYDKMLIKSLFLHSNYKELVKVFERKRVVSKLNENEILHLIYISNLTNEEKIKLTKLKLIKDKIKVVSSRLFDAYYKKERQKLIDKIKYCIKNNINDEILSSITFLDLNKEIIP